MAEQEVTIDLHQARIEAAIGPDGKEFCSVTELLQFLVLVGVYRIDESGSYKLIQGESH